MSNTKKKHQHLFSELVINSVGFITKTGQWSDFVEVQINYTIPFNNNNNNNNSKSN